MEDESKKIRTEKLVSLVNSVNATAVRDNLSVLAFYYNGSETATTLTGPSEHLVAMLANAIIQSPEFNSILSRAMDMVEEHGKSELPRNEEEYADMLIDRALMSKEAGIKDALYLKMDFPDLAKKLELALHQFDIEEKAKFLHFVYKDLEEDRLRELLTQYPNDLSVIMLGIRGVCQSEKEAIDLLLEGVTNYKTKES